VIANYLKINAWIFYILQSRRSKFQSKFMNYLNYLNNYLYLFFNSWCKCYCFRYRKFKDG